MEIDWAVEVLATHSCVSRGPSVIGYDPATLFGLQEGRAQRHLRTKNRDLLKAESGRSLPHQPVLEQHVCLEQLVDLDQIVGLEQLSDHK